MRAFSLISITVLAAVPQPALAGDKNWSTASSIGAYGLAGVALGAPLVSGDTQGALQAGESIAAAELATYGLKKAFPETRPDGSDRKSFPSGHTSLAFASAATLNNRSGWQAAVPAYLVATFVGVARVEADKHHWYDVLAGAAVGETAGLLLTRKRDASVRIVPWGDPKEGGVAFDLRF